MTACVFKYRISQTRDDGLCVCVRFSPQRWAFPDGQSVLNYFSIDPDDTTTWILLLIVNTGVACDGVGKTGFF
jgi:hypothetical protein